MPSAEYSEHHVWVAAATIRLDPRQAKRAVLRHSIRLPEGRKIDVLEIYCEQCRRTWDDVVDEPCEAAKSNAHLHGGPIGTRRKRKHDHDCELLGCNPRPDAAQQTTPLAVPR